MIIKPFFKRLEAALLLAVMPLTAATPGHAAGSQIFGRHVPKEMAARLVSTGRLPDTQQMSFSIGLPLRNQAVLDKMLSEVSDPSSPNYRHYLTPAQFTEQFGPTAKDFEAVAAFAEAHGLKVTYRHSNRLILDVDGAVSDVEKMLHVRMMKYKHPKEAREFFAPDVEPSIDLTVPIADINGLSTYSLPQPGIQPMPANQGAAPAGGSGDFGNYGGADFRAAYLPNTTLTGSGQSVGLLEFDTYYASDIASYVKRFSLPNVPLVTVPINGGVANPLTLKGSAEVSADIEVVMAMAPGISNIYVYEASPANAKNWDDMLSRMAADNVKNLSCSWFGGNTNPDTTADGVFKEMAMQGQSFYNASGDVQAYSAAIPFPDDNPYITQVGGTALTTAGPGGSYTSETVWTSGGGVGSSGGISTSYTIPPWQQPVSMANNQGSTTMRNTPDVALTAIQVAIYFNNGTSGFFTGTSAAAPLWAGFTALVNQQCGQHGLPSVGFVNPAIYQIGLGQSFPNYGSSFHDITSGNNFNTASPSKYSAVAGYDLCNRLGNTQRRVNRCARPAPAHRLGSVWFGRRRQRHVYQSLQHADDRG